MKSVTGYVVVALLLAVAALVSWRLGNDQRQVAVLHEELQTMQYAAATRSEAAGSLGPLSRLPAVGGDMAADARAGQSSAAYWLAKYDALKPAMDSSKPADRDPRLLLFGANAAYRATEGQTIDRATALQHLDQVINGYRDVMRINPDDGDAAYNYELVVRLRNDLARQRGTAAVAKAAVPEEGPPTIHGRPGASPKGASMSDFKTTIPQRNEERQEQRRENENAGKGNQKTRKG